MTIKELPRRTVSNDEKCEMVSLINEVSRSVTSGDTYGFVIMCVGPPGANVANYHYMAKGASQVALTHALTLALRDHIEQCADQSDYEEET